MSIDNQNILQGREYDEEVIKQDPFKEDIKLISEKLLIHLRRILKIDDDMTIEEQSKQIAEIFHNITRDRLDELIGAEITEMWGETNIVMQDFYAQNPYSMSTSNYLLHLMQLIGVVTFRDNSHSSKVLSFNLILEEGIYSIKSTGEIRQLVEF